MLFKGLRCAASSVCVPSAPPHHTCAEIGCKGARDLADAAQGRLHISYGMLLQRLLLAVLLCFAWFFPPSQRYAHVPALSFVSWAVNLNLLTCGCGVGVPAFCLPPTRVSFSPFVGLLGLWVGGQMAGSSTKWCGKLHLVYPCPPSSYMHAQGTLVLTSVVKNRNLLSNL